MLFPCAGHRQNAFVNRGAQGRLAMRLLRLKPAYEMIQLPARQRCGYKRPVFTPCSCFPCAGHRQDAFVSRGAQGRFAMRLLRLKPADEMI
jgi:hypothetical protein